ncbi:septum site-determining protein Ssd [Tessaracoccus sp.]
MRTTMKDVECLLVTRDPALVDAVQAMALALGTAVALPGGRDELRMLWPGAGVRLVGPDMASRVADLGAVDGGTWVVGQAGEALLAASAELDAPALALPQASARLAEVLTQRRDPDPQAGVVALVGGSGGVGTSSLAVAVGLVAARRGARVAVVELAHCGGGIDLIMGLEASPGMRWNDLANASGELGSLEGQLMTGSGVSVLALGRTSDEVPSHAAVGTVLRGLGRSHELIVVDAGDGRHLGWLGDAQPVFIAAAHVRGVAAARMVAEHTDLARSQLLVRTGPGSTLPAAAVAEALGLPLTGVIRHDRAVPKLMAAGSSIMAAPARRFRRDVNRLVDGLLG